MSQELSLLQRRRPPTAQELAGIPWLARLLPAERDYAVAAVVVGDADSGDY
ncbi:MAG: Crp/Fnr family transcriptional regulator, partial [Proteobacteria bacterium]|nr:Crp/Fnr family transcriptional regulator [Pseudomonadota bacterium]